MDAGMIEFEALFDQDNIYPVDDSFEFLQNLKVPKPEHTIAFALDEAISCFVARSMFGFIMLTAIKFDDDLGRMTDKIHDIAPNRRLPFELCATKTATAQYLPQLPLNVRHLAAKVSRVLTLM